MIENYQRQSNEIDKEIHVFLHNGNGAGEALGNRISFAKGKPAQKDGEEPLPYLNMEYMSGQSKETSCGGVLATADDVLMLMDGASSGSVFIGASGFVGSTFAVIKHDRDINPYVLYAVLKEKEDLFKTRTTGSAIPHTDKAFVASIEYPVLPKETIDKIEFLLKRKSSFKKLIEGLKANKWILLNKYFSTSR